MAGRTRKDSWAVIGAGHGGQALAAYLALKGEKVSLYNRTPERLDGIRQSGGIALEGALEGFAQPELISPYLGEVLEGARVVMIAVPASAHAELARKMAPHLEAGQIVVLNPGRTLGAVQFAYELKKAGGTPDIIVGETNTFLFASRWLASGRSRIHRVKKRVRFATLPATHTALTLRVLKRALPMFEPATNVIETGICNIGAIFHPAPVLLNSGWVESQRGFDHYHHGITPGVARALEALDAERMALARAFRVRALSAKRWLSSVYGSMGDSLHGAIQRTDAYTGLKAPTSLEHRYVFEDVPASLVPLSDMARIAGEATPVMRSLVVLAGAVTGVDWVEHGRTLASVGLGDMGVGEIIEFVNVGLRRMPRWASGEGYGRAAEGFGAEADALLSLEGS